jgi:3-oxoacyl-[acyl-carrier protein] reductase
MKTLENKVAVITGGNGKVALATAARLADQGARIISIVRRDYEKSVENMSQLPNNHLHHFSILASVKDTTSIKEAAKIVKEKAGKCNILINAAGITSSVNSVDDETFDDIILTNLRGTFVTIREFLNLLKIEDNSLIINISSTSAFRSTRGHPAYVASKAGINALTQNLAKNLGHRIRVVGVAPGYLEHSTSGATPRNETQNSQAIGMSSLKRLGKADDVAEVIEKLSTSMDFITGQTIVVDGGMTL